MRPEWRQSKQPGRSITAGLAIVLALTGSIVSLAACGLQGLLPSVPPTDLPITQTLAVLNVTGTAMVERTPDPTIYPETVMRPNGEVVTYLTFRIEPNTGNMAAGGTFEVVDGCLRLDSYHHRTVILNSHYRVDADEEGIKIYDSYTGELLAEEGKAYTFGGGGYPQEWLEAQELDLPLETCPPPYLAIGYSITPRDE